jgi:hypothetical protein
MNNLFDDIDSTPEPSPFEALFNIEPGSTEITALAPIDAHKIGGGLIDPSTGEILEQTATADSAVIEKEDRLEDLKLQAHFDNIHTAAMGAFTQQQMLSQQVDPKFSARNSEVAAQFLSIALQTTAARAEAKNKRQKIRIATAQADTPNTVNNNVIVASRNDVLRHLFASGIDATVMKTIEAVDK